MKRISFSVAMAVAVVFALLNFPVQAKTIGSYSRIYEGIEYATGSTSSPRTEKAWALRISLRNPDVSMYASHNNGTSSYEVALQATDAFLSDHALEIAVNASFYDPGLSPNTDVWGYVVSNGTQVSGPYAAPFNSQLYFTSTKAATLRMSGSTSPSAYNGVSGAEQILVNGSINTSNSNVNPHTGMGLSQDGRYLIIVCVDGRQPGWSEGCDYPEMAQWLEDFGAYNGIMMDGGGSTCMVRADAGVVNSPCYGYVRQVGVSLGAHSVATGNKGPSAVAMNADRVDVVIRGNGNDVWQKTWTSSGGWAAAVNLGGDTEDNPAINSRVDGMLNVFCRNISDDSLYRKTWDSVSGWNNWSGSLGGNIKSGPAAVSMNENRIDIVARSAGHNVNHITWIDGDWGEWESLGGDTPDTPAICSKQDGKLSVFYRGYDDKLYRRAWDSQTGWNNWSGSLGGSLLSGPVAISRDANHIDIFARGWSASLQHISWDSVNDWGTWESLSNNCISKPGVCCPDANTMKVYYRSENDHLYEKVWTNTGGWATESDLGPYYE